MCLDQIEGDGLRFVGNCWFSAAVCVGVRVDLPSVLCQSLPIFKDDSPEVALGVAVSLRLSQQWRTYGISNKSEVSLWRSVVAIGMDDLRYTANISTSESITTLLSLLAEQNWNRACVLHSTLTDYDRLYFGPCHDTAR